MFSDTLRLEFQPFGITVVDRRTAVARTNLIRNMREEKKPSGFDIRACQRSGGEGATAGEIGRYGHAGAVTVESGREWFIGKRIRHQSFGGENRHG